MAEITKCLKLLPLLNEHCQNWLHSLLQLIGIHLRNEWVCCAGKHWTSTQPNLIRLSSIANESQFGHVWSSASIRTSCHTHEDFFIIKVHLSQQCSHTLNVGRHDALGFSLCEPTERKGRTCHRQSCVGIYFLDRFDAMLSQHLLNSFLILWINISENDTLCRTQNRVQVVLVHKNPQRRLETEVPFILNTAIINVLSIEQLSVSLLEPSHPIVVFPVSHGTPGLDFHAGVTLYQLGKFLNSKGVHKVLHTGVRPDITIAMITLSSQDSLHDLPNMFLWYESHVVGSTCKSTFLVVEPSHSSTNHHIEPFQFSRVVGDNNNANIIGVNI
mmetsp:Transcript_24664/g.40689  ORF Transcript_24664/g.40689 Transcript_24664/m.40689 type:complete len:329 (-) Transcript_24664:948-1934(-)